MAKEKKPKKAKVEKPFNSGTMSNAAFWNFIRQSLRRRTLVWKPMQNVRKAAKRPYIGPNKRRKFSYECSSCHNLFASEEISVHHLVEVGSLKCAEDLPGFVLRMFCEEKDLCCICSECHLKLHKKSE